LDVPLTNGELQTLVVTTPQDVVDPSDGLRSLRECLAAAADQPGDDTITFSSLFDTPQTITLNGTPLNLNGNGAVTIAGPAGRVSITANYQSRVFTLDNGNTATITNANIQNGSASFGAAIRSDGALTLAGVVVSGAKSFSGAVSSNGTLTITDSLLTGNSGTLTSALGASGFTMRNTVVAGNTCGDADNRPVPI
jgi:hypothetical protein